MDSVAAWLVLTIFALSGVGWVLWRCVEHDRRRRAESEYYWQTWEKEVKKNEAPRFLQSARDLDRRVYPRYERGGFSEVL